MTQEFSDSPVFLRESQAVVLPRGNLDNAPINQLCHQHRL